MNTLTIDKDQSRRIRAAIRDVLMSHWDPIGVKDEPNAADEYDGYIGEVCELPGRNATADEIAARLLWIETARMGLTGDYEPTPVYLP